jgi:hypothetical protein
MQRIDSRTVQFTLVEMDIRQDTEDWDETTDPVEFILDTAATYGVTVQEDFVYHLAIDMVAGSTDGFVLGKPFAGSTIEVVGYRDETTGTIEHDQVGGIEAGTAYAERTHLTMGLADGRTFGLV